MEQSKAMEYGSQKASDVLKPRNIYNSAHFNVREIHAWTLFRDNTSFTICIQVLIVSKTIIIHTYIRTYVHTFHGSVSMSERQQNVAQVIHKYMQFLQSKII